MLQLLNHIPNSHARRDELNHRLDHLPRPERVQLLLLALDDPYPPIRHDVAEALQQELDANLTTILEEISLGRSPAVELTDAFQIPGELLPRGSERARVAACVALEASPTPAKTLKVIAELLLEDSADLRYQAIIAMHHLDGGSDALREQVTRSLQDPDAEIVVVASQIAVTSGWGDFLPALVEARQRLRGEDRRQLTFSIGELISASDATAQELEPQVRAELIDDCVRALRLEPLTAAAARTLANLGATEATDDLQRVINRFFVHPILKVDAAEALLILGHPGGEEYIGKALNSRRKDARGYALRIIGKHRLARYFDHLATIAAGDFYHADTATLALADFGGDRARDLLTHLQHSHPDAEVRKLAAEGLQFDGTSLPITSARIEP